jgi:hypothetical protein
MITMFRAATAAFAIASIGPAIAGEGEGTIANTLFTHLQGMIPVQDAQHVTLVQDGDLGSAYVTQSSHGTWLFPPHDGGGDNQ